MPPKGNAKKKTAAKTYTSESLMMRSIAGVVLLALGVLVFLAAAGLMDGVIFQLLAEVSAGLAGGLGMLLCVYLIWAGVLCFISARQPAPMKPFVLAVLMGMFALAAVDLFSQAWDAQSRTAYSFMDYLRVINQRDVLQAAPGGFMQMLERGYILCQQTNAGGGALGILLAWPLWMGLGSIGGGIVSVIVCIALGFVLTRFDFRKWFGVMKQRSAERQAARQQEQAIYAQQQAQWNREEQMRQQEAGRQRQARQAAIAQQRAYEKQQAYARQQQANAYQPVYEDDGYYDDFGPEEGFYEETVVQSPVDHPVMNWDKKPARKPAKEKPVPVKREAVKPQEVLPDPDFEDDMPPWDEEETVEDVSAPAAPPLPVVKSVPRTARTRPVHEETPAVKEQPPVRKAAVQPAVMMSGEQFDVPKVKLPPRKQEEAKQIEMDLPTPYTYPSLNLLKAPAPARAESHSEDLARSEKLEQTLESFRIPAKVKNVTHGPAIARFELEIASGINVSRVANIDKNIAMNLEVKSVRIEAPIPGKSLVGVEVPNRSISAVTLREVLESPEMRRMESPLAVALGKDIAGQPIVCDLERMPHLLIAGATGSGKSVCINAIINSIIYRATPQQVKMILIDPKMVELQCYNCLPHLLVPVVSDPHKAAGALAWVVSEMMERYQKFKEHSVRNITGYNASLFDGEESMSRIVVIIDELADLMMTCKKDVEEYICRLAQLARAAGIHLVVATQRPSVDVITGLIKANIPSRIAFTVSSSIDSRTILDRVGAEKLLGRGDMLYLPNGELTPFRVQGCFLSDEEVNRVTDFVKRTSVVEFDPDVLEKLEESAPVAGSAPDDADPVDMGDGEDPLLSQAIELAVQDGQTSISMLQRRLRIGHSRAGRIVDEMSRRGILSQADGSKPRQVLISREEYEEMCRVSEE